MAPRNPNPDWRTTLAFPSPVAHRFDPLDYEALRQEPLRTRVERLSRIVRYPTSWTGGAFSDQSLPLLPTPLVFIGLALALGVVAHLAAVISKLSGFAPTWLGVSPYLVAIAAGLGTWAFIRILRYASPGAFPLAVELLIAFPAGLVIVAALRSSTSPALRLVLVVASLAATGVFAHAVADHVRTHLRAFSLEPQTATTDLLGAVTPYLVLFVPLVCVYKLAGVSTLLVLPWLPAYYLAHRALEARPGVFRSPLHLLSVAASSWLRFGTRGDEAPGVVRSPAGPPVARLVATVLLILLLATLFSPFPFRVSSWLGTALAWIGAALVPLSIMGSACLALLAVALPDVPALKFAGDEPLLTDPERWGLVTERLRAAEEKDVRNQLLVGFHATEHYPVFLPRQTLREHAAIVGATSAGKTSRVLLPLLSQLARIDEVEGAPRGPLVVIDLKGERYFFNAVRKEAEDAGRPFLYFSNHPHRGTHAFNPVLDLRELGILLAQVGATLHAGLNLEHGTGYGASYFSSVTRNYLASLLELAPEAESVAELYAAREKLRKLYPRDRERREIEREAAELISYLKALASRPELNVTARSGRPECFEHRISMKRALEEDAVLYFNLFSKGEEAVARFIGSLALECLYAATYRYNEDPPDDAKGRPRKQVYAVVDEFQRIAGRNFGVFLEQARSAGLSLILAKQSETFIEPELNDAVQTNTTYRHFFSFRTPDAITAAGTVFGETAYYSAVDVGLTTLKHSLGPRFTANDLRSLSALPGYAASVQETSRDFSLFHGQGVAIYSPFHITSDERDRRAGKPLPVGEPGTLLVGEVTPEERTGQGQETSYVSPPEPLAGTELAACFERIQATHERYSTQEVS